MEPVSFIVLTRLTSYEPQMVSQATLRPFLVPLQRASPSIITQKALRDDMCMDSPGRLRGTTALSLLLLIKWNECLTFLSLRITAHYFTSHDACEVCKIFPTYKMEKLKHSEVKLLAEWRYKNIAS